jgi:hypothetical protein
MRLFSTHKQSGYVFAATLNATEYLPHWRGLTLPFIIRVNKQSSNISTEAMVMTLLLLMMMMIYFYGLSIILSSSEHKIDDTAL